MVLTRFPRLGEVKTRLVPPLTAEAALALHDRLARHAVARARALAVTGEARVEVRADAAYARAASEWLGVPGISYRYQGDGTLGDKLRRAFAEGFMRGDGKIVVIGADCPRLTPEHLRDALRRLDGADVVLGPAVDGGYYLIAIRREAQAAALAELFADIAWGTPTVLDSTIAACERAGLSFALLGELPDVDRPEDLADAETALAAAERSITPGEDARVSVVIPVLNDAGFVGEAVDRALAGGAAEVIVVDGGSADGSREVAAAAGARVLESAPGRAAQLNAGAAAASGEVLLFVHADTLVPPHAARLAARALSQPGVVAGAFGFSVRTDSRHPQLLTFAGRVRAQATGHPHGDQCLFVSAGVFREVGGYPEIATMEDWELVARLKRLGRVVMLPEVAVTSARTWDEFGLVWPTALNAAVIAGYRLGIDPDRLAEWRRRIAPPARFARRNR
jgi:rSAM/selenodomain-associated transferase 2/rSAM/selenodomain-associated transferase 1